MEIDGFTLFAQLVNFAILVAILKKLLYGPILRMVEDREQQFVDRASELAERERELSASQEHYRELCTRLEGQADEMRQDVLTEVEQEKQRRLEGVRQELAAMEASWKRALKERSESFSQELQREAGQQILALVRRILLDLTNRDLQEVVVRKCLQDWEPGTEVDRIVSAFPLSEAERQKWTSDSGTPALEVDPSLVLGIELYSEGSRYGWSVASYLEELASRMEGFLKEGADATVAHG